MQIAVDEDGFVLGEQDQPLLDPIGGIREQARVVTETSPGGLDLLERRTHDRWVVRRPRPAGERVGAARAAAGPPGRERGAGHATQRQGFR